MRHNGRDHTASFWVEELKKNAWTKLGRGGHAWGFLLINYPLSDGECFYNNKAINFVPRLLWCFRSQNSPSLYWTFKDCYATDVNLTISKPEIQWFCLSCLECNAVSLVIIGWGRVWFEELGRSRRVLSTKVEGYWWMTPSEICISSYHTKGEFNNCLIIHSNISTALKFNKTVTDNK